MTRDEWLKLPDSLKNPVYLTFSPERMYMFWLQKRDELLSLEWNELEKKHINLLYDYIKDRPRFFYDEYFDNETLLTQFDVFMSNWYHFAINELSWNKAIAYYVAASCDFFSDDMLLVCRPGGGGLGDVIIDDGGLGESSCMCNTVQDFCDPFGETGGVSCKDKYSCEGSVQGCGWFWRQPCNGLCVGNFV